MEKPINSNGGLLICQNCGTHFGRRQDANKFSYLTTNNGARTGTEVEVIPNQNGVAQYKFTCKNCRSGQIYVSINEKIEISDENSTKKKCCG